MSHRVVALLRIVPPLCAEIHSMEASTIIQALAEPERMEPFVIVEAAAPHKIVASNKPFCALTGFASQELVGRSVATLHGPLSCCETLAALGLAMNGANAGHRHTPLQKASAP